MNALGLRALAGANPTIKVLEKYATIDKNEGRS
jgi:hypothetical protein